MKKQTSVILTAFYLQPSPKREETSPTGNEGHLLKYKENAFICKKTVFTINGFKK